MIAFAVYLYLDELMRLICFQALSGNCVAWFTTVGARNCLHALLFCWSCKRPRMASLSIRRSTGGSNSAEILLDKQDTGVTDCLDHAFCAKGEKGSPKYMLDKRLAESLMFAHRYVAQRVDNKWSMPFATPALAAGCGQQRPMCGHLSHTVSIADDDARIADKGRVGHSAEYDKPAPAA